MGGKVAAHNTRMTVVLRRALRGWLNEEAQRLGVTASDIVKGAVEHLRRQSAEDRRRIVASAMPPPEGGNGGAGTPRA